MDKNRREKWHDIIIHLPVFLEKIIAVVLLVGVVYGVGKLVLTAVNFSGTFEVYIDQLMNTAFSIIIIIEFIRMLIRHSMNTVVEVLIFAIARGLVVGHVDSINALISIVAIGVLLACRKFLFHEFDFEEEV
ncbi:MAG: hypothetical protein E7273_06595 [Pseudobutyrivibrio ruminis]|nr:hypothetical protein [Pseudobutyrivibrio ruminis]